jgi:protein gp37
MFDMIGGTSGAGWSDFGDRFPNVWLGVSVENQAAADERIPWLLKCPAAVRFLSCEPLLGEIDIRTHLLSDYDKEAHDPRMTGLECGWNKVDWVIVGGESGPHARPMHLDWVRSVRDQCQEWRTPFFFKQWGEWDPERRRVGKKAAGNVLDGWTWEEFPIQAAEAKGDE